MAMEWARLLISPLTGALIVMAFNVWIQSSILINQGEKKEFDPKLFWCSFGLVLVGVVLVIVSSLLFTSITIIKRIAPNEGYFLMMFSVGASIVIGGFGMVLRTLVWGAGDTKEIGQQLRVTLKYWVALIIVIVGTFIWLSVR
jgi:uncharacterized membrane protein YidH (DUF202 family)